MLPTIDDTILKRMIALDEERMKGSILSADDAIWWNDHLPLVQEYYTQIWIHWFSIEPFHK